MGVDFYECRCCREVHDDCGYLITRTCEKCKENICSDCVDKFIEEHINLSKIKYWNCSQPAVENNCEDLLEEFCPLCNAKEKNDG